MTTPYEEPPPTVTAVPRPVPKRRVLTEAQHIEGVARGDRTILARTITLVESQNPEHRAMARRVLTALMPRTGTSVWVSITGVPGVGKSTFIDQLGVNLTNAGRKVAVLAVDPSSGVSGGSILGDKTRMARLCADQRAFIRPSPSAGTLGGVASKTRESLLLCEAAGYDVVLVETVGVGQSETVVADMTDIFLALMLPGAGDELQGIKRGLLERVDIVGVNKADKGNEDRAKLAAQELRNALRLTRPHGPGSWVPPVLTVSAAENRRLDELWERLEGRVVQMREEGVLDDRRRAQSLRWMWSLVDEGLRAMLREEPRVRSVLAAMSAGVEQGSVPPTEAADRVLRAFGEAVLEG